MSVWTKPLVVKRFEQLFADELSYDEIARTLSREFNVEISRNAAIGFGKRKNMPQRKNGQRPRKPATQIERRNEEPKLPPAPFTPKPVIGKGTLTIVQLKPRSCRWPFGDWPPFLYCGCRTVEGHPYCEDHMKLGHVRWQSHSAA